MNVARVMAERSTCARRKVGCVLVDRHQNFLSEGFNGVESGAPHCSEGHHCPAVAAASGVDLDGCLAVHAEINALVSLRSPWQAHSLYVTTSPCLSCLKAIMRTSIKRIVFAEPYIGEEEARRRWVTRWDREWKHLKTEDTELIEMAEEFVR